MGLYGSKKYPQEVADAIKKYIDGTADAVGRVSLGDNKSIPPSLIKLESLANDEVPNTIRFLKEYSDLAQLGKKYTDRQVDILFEILRSSEKYLEDTGLSNTALKLLRDAMKSGDRIDKVIAIDSFAQIAHEHGSWLPLILDRNTLSGYSQAINLENRVIKVLEEISIGKFEPVKGTEYMAFDKIRQDAWDEAQRWYYKEYPDYTNANAIDDIMKQIYPYWIYESQRWPWLLRATLRHPVVGTTLARYMQNTDNGKMHIPGTNIDINPFSGTVFGGAIRLSNAAEYSDYYNEAGIMTKPFQFNELLQRYGFYPGQPWSGLISLLGGGSPQTGEEVPSLLNTPLNLMIAIAPDNKFISMLTEKLLPSKFRDYTTSMAVTHLGGDGTTILAKIHNSEKLTEEETELWNSGKRQAALYNSLAEMTSIFRLNYDEKVKAAEQSAQIIFQMTGITPVQQEELKRQGKNVWDVVGGIDPNQQRILQELDLYKWVGATNALLPAAQQAEYDRLELDWNDITLKIEGDKSLKQTILRDFLSAAIGPSDYLSSLKEVYKNQQEYIKNKELENPNLTLEGRAEMYKKYGKVTPVMSPFRELLNLYYSVELTERYDEETGEKITDWEAFYATRKAIEDSIPDELKGEWNSYMERNQTSLDKLYATTSEKYFRKYYSVWDEALKQFNEVEQRLINEYLHLQRTGQNIDRQREIEAITTTGTSEGEVTQNFLISTFRRSVSDNRKALRYANPILDAWLNYWGKASSFLTPQAESTYRRLLIDTGRVQ
jgi:hypothetical protein